MEKWNCNIESLAKYIWKLNNVLSDEKDNMCIRFAWQLPLNYFPGERDGVLNDSSYAIIHLTGYLDIYDREIWGKQKLLMEQVYFGPVRRILNGSFLSDIVYSSTDPMNFETIKNKKQEILNTLRSYLITKNLK